MIKLKRKVMEGSVVFVFIRNFARLEEIGTNREHTLLALSNLSVNL